MAAGAFKDHKGTGTLILRIYDVVSGFCFWILVFHSSLSIFSVQGRGAGHRAILGILASSIGVSGNTNTGMTTGSRDAPGCSHIAISSTIIQGGVGGRRAEVRPLVIHVRIDG